MSQFFAMVDPHDPGPRENGGLAMSGNEPQDRLTVLYDGECPLCRREIAHLSKLASRAPSSALCFVDLTRDDARALVNPETRERLLARFHVEQADGSRLSGAAAFAAMWARLPGWRWLARLARLPGMLALMEVGYLGFLKLRPLLQALARRLEKS